MLRELAFADDELLGPGRCFSYWQDVLGCYVVNTNTDDVSGAKKCAPVLEDYYECLHHKKEVSGVNNVRIGGWRGEEWE